MKIKVTLTPAEISLLPAADLSQETCVVFDVLRATSTMVTALHHGATGIYPAADLEEALALRRLHPDALLGGERRSEKIEGFDLGNSPLEYLQVAGRTIISTTTNGTVALRACAGARKVLAGSLLNRAATADYLRQSGCEIMRIVCAGTGQDFAAEDAVGGGALIAALPGADLGDAAGCLLELWQVARADPFKAVRASVNGRRLMEIGRGEEVRWCAQVDVFPVVAQLREGFLTTG